MSNHLPYDKKLRVLGCLTEGCSIRSTMRMTGVNRETIGTFLSRMGLASVQLMDSKMRDLSCAKVQVDEMWSYIGKKERWMRSSDPENFGNTYTWIAICEETKMVPAFYVGKRTSLDATEFLDDLAGRIVGEFQISTDKFAAYSAVIKKVFGDRVKHVHSASNSYVERQNMTLRMNCRRYSRHTNAFSKSYEQHVAATALHFASYNFCRKNRAVKTAPAVAAGIADHVWTLEELLTIESPGRRSGRAQDGTADATGSH